MTDIRSLYTEAFLAADYALEAGSLQTEDGLETAVVISLFTDRRANPDDELPAGAGDTRRGWWGDAVAPTVDGVAVDGARIGSRLWLLAREKQTPETVVRARAYALEALEWLIEDGVAETVEVEAEIVRAGILGLRIVVQRPSGDAAAFRFAHAWDAQQSGGRHAVR